MGDSSKLSNQFFKSVCTYILVSLLTRQYLPHKETEVSGNMHMNTVCSEYL